MKNIVVFIVLTFQLAIIYSDRVLVLQPFSPRSHKIIIEPIAIALGSRGHHVTFVSPFKFEDSPPPNVTDIAFPEYIESFNELEDIVIETILYGWMPSTLKKYYDMHKGLCQRFYDSGLLQKWMAAKQKFKLVIYDSVFTECILPLWKSFAEHVILINTSVMTPMIVEVMKLPIPYSHVPYTITGYTQNMNFVQRCINTIYWLMHVYFHYLCRTSVYENIVLPNFPDTKTNDQTLSNISLILVNEDPVFSMSRPYLSTVVLVGGIHCRPSKPLPEDDLKRFVDDSGEDGFILVSFGSIIKAKFMSNELRTNLITAFSKIKQRVIWKYDGELTGLSKNVKLVKWFPQNDLLGHPKLQTFINQGGLNSVQESLYHSVPQVCFPMTSDQPHLVAIAEELGIVIKLDFRYVTVDELVGAINKTSNDLEMRKKVQYYSEVFRYSKVEPLVTAVYWIEFVMKFNGAMHLQSAGANLNVFQYYLLDVYAVYFLIVAFFVYMMWICIKKIIGLIYPSKFTGKKKYQ